MAGAYPDAPSRRMAWDADGTVAVYSSTGITNAPSGTPPSGAYIALTGGEKQTLNNEDVNDALWTGQFGNPKVWVSLLFPELREIDGAHLNFNHTLDWFDTSGDSTNGTSGTFVDTGYSGITNTDSESYRNDITSLAIPTETCTRHMAYANGANRINGRSYHIYGTFSPTETPDRMVFLDTENSDAVFTKVLDYAEVPRGQTKVRTIKLKNNSAGKTINTISITAEDLYLNAGGWYTFGDDDITYAATFAVGSLGPAGEKLIYVKQSIPDLETLGLQTGRFKVTHVSVV